MYLIQGVDMKIFNDKRISKLKAYVFEIPEHSLETLDKALKKLMGATGYTEGKLSQRVGLSTTAIYHYLHALRKPDNNIMEKIAKTFDVKPSYFLEYRLNELCDYCKRQPKLVDIFLDIASDPDRIIAEWELEEQKQKKAEQSIKDYSANNN